ncbi:MAG TPA: hypothetical protein VKS24_03935 [Bradyrhizobium sp.]|nr:hypothetical protein [Bradyrhizobium sp.]
MTLRAAVAGLTAVSKSALSRQRELPNWLDSCMETGHADLPLAILNAFVDAQRVSVPSVRTSVPTAASAANPL